MTAEWKAERAMILQDWVSQDAKHNGEVQNDVTSCFTCQTGSDSISLIDLFRFHRKRVSWDAECSVRAQNVLIFCFARQTGSDSISLPDNSAGLFPK